MEKNFRDGLSKLLPADAVAEVEKLHAAGDYAIGKLKPITDLYKAELLAKGVDANFLAHLISHLIFKSK
jgi:hypothetical protein